MNRWHVTAFFTALASAAPGCGKSNEPVDLGNHHPRSIGANLSDYAGVWNGYAEAYPFNDGTDAVRLTLRADGEGTLEVGEAGPLPPPDANHNYRVAREAPVGKLVSGFAYPIANSTVADDRIKFTTYGIEIYREWCGLLTPHSFAYRSPFEEGYAGAGIPNGTTVYSCWPLVGREIGFRSLLGGDDECVDLGVDENVVIPCGPSECERFCECTEATCSLIPGEQYQSRWGLDPAVRFDGALSSNGQMLEGTLVIQTDNVTETNAARVRVRLTKQ